MHPIEYYLETISRRILRLGLPAVLTILLYTCWYIYTAAPDGGVMTSFLHTVAELLGNAIATLGLLIAAAAIPDVKLF